MMVSLKKILTLSTITIVCFACGKKEKELSPAEINVKADSIVKSKLERMHRQAKEDLDRRLPIELKPKVDSIRNVSHEIGALPVFPQDGLTDSTGAALQLADTPKK